MLITCHGHSEFLIESASGFTLLTDPFNAEVGYRMEQYAVDAVAVSHGHGDHSFVEKAVSADPGQPLTVIRQEGTYSLAENVTVTAIPSYHDDVQGTKRGGNLLFRMEIDGLTLAHLGDIGAPLTPQQRAALGRVDILMLPVGGFFTIDAVQAKAIADQLRPAVLLPMHYKTAVNAQWPIADAEAFLTLMAPQQAETCPILRVTKGDLSEQPPLILLKPSCI